MANLKVYLRYCKQEQGISLWKLASVSDKLFNFLNSVCEDRHLRVNKNKWIACQFGNKSVSFVVKNLDAVNEKEAEEYNDIVRKIAKKEFDESNYGKTINPYTVKQMVHIIDDIDINESLIIGLYNGKAKPEEFKLNQQISCEINEKAEQLDKDFGLLLEGTYKYYGGIRGKIQSWFIGSDEPHITIKDAKTNRNIKCYYSEKLYNEIQSLTQRKNAFIYISGTITAIKIDNKIESIFIKKALAAPQYEEGDWEKFLGCAPNITGGLSSEDYIQGIRNNGE